MTDNEMAELEAICPGARLISEGETNFIYLPSLRIANGNVSEQREALLSLGPHSGYTSRLYLSAPIAGKGQNWTVHTVLGRAWHTPSYNMVQVRRPAEMLADHLGVYR